jgi:cation transport protein ChaC
LSSIERPHSPFQRLSDSERLISLQAVLAARAAPHDIYVFAYGSMMWDPLFEPAERHAANLDGYRRSFCVWSLVARGTPENPGLALGLEDAAGASCDGIVFRLNPFTTKADLEATWRREMYTAIYQPKWLDVETVMGKVRAISFAIETGHPQYAAGLDQNEAASIIASAEGENGRCRDYLSNTVSELAAIGCVDSQIEALNELVESLPAGKES